MWITVWRAAPPPDPGADTNELYAGGLNGSAFQWAVRHGVPFLHLDRSPLPRGIPTTGVCGLVVLGRPAARPQWHLLGDVR